MSRLLEWRSAHRSDRGALSVFECTSPAKKRKVPPYGYEHPRRWELAVQKLVRQLQPPIKPPCHTLVGADDDGLGAVAHYEELDGPGLVHLGLMAVALRFRGQGGGYADELVEFALGEIVDRAISADRPEVRISAHVHHLNHASQHLCRRWKFRHTDMWDDEYQLWVARILLPTEHVDYADGEGPPIMARR